MSDWLPGSRLLIPGIRALVPEGFTVAKYGRIIRIRKMKTDKYKNRLFLVLQSCFFIFATMKSDINMTMLRKTSIAIGK